MSRSSATPFPVLVLLLLPLQIHGISYLHADTLLPGSQSAGHTDAIAYSNPIIEAMVDSVSGEILEANLDTLTRFFTRNSVSDTVSDSVGIGAARRWIHGKFEEYGAAGAGRLETAYFDFNESICGIEGTHRNVMATLPGTMPQSEDRLFLVGGHMDSRNSSLCDTENFAPGTNDDGSGVVAALELARIMSRFEFDATLIFSVFTGEEQGLFGSTHYAEFARGNDFRIDGMINNDMIGNVTDDVGAVDSTSVRHFSVGPSDSPSRQLSRYMRLKAEQYVPGFIVNLIPAQDRPGRGGDHMPFNDNGYAAARLIETNEASSHQHNELDILDYMYIPYLAQVVRVNVAGLASLALAPASPMGLEVVDVGNGTDLDLSWPATNTEPDFAGYRVAVRLADSLFYDQIASVGDTNHFTLGGLNDGEAVYISISALDADGNESIFSSEVLATPRNIPFPPTGLESTSRTDQVDLSWSPNGELDLMGYNVYRGTASGGSCELIDFVPKPAVTWSDGDIDPHMYYYYRITAVDLDDQESDFSGEVKGRLATHDSGVMIVDATIDGSGAPLQPTDERVDAYYESLLSSYHVTAGWDRADSLLLGNWITDADMGIYSTIVWHTDRTSGNSFQDTTAMRKFLDSGGRLLLTGWNLANSVGGSAGFDHSFPAGTFMHDYGKVDSARTTPVPDADFAGAENLVQGYPSLAVDTAKVILFDGNLFTMDVFLPPLVDEPITEAVYGYISSQGGGSPNHGLPVGLRHIDNDLKIVLFDFPLFFVDSVSAMGAITQAMIDLGEPVGTGDDHPEDQDGIPRAYALNQNYPNPFNPETTIEYALTEPTPVQLSIYNILGQRVRILVNEEQNAGYYRIHWNGKDESGRAVASGVYLYKLEAGEISKTRKMLLIK